ncbi:unnamed protein product, partial [Rotaria sp. Silwood1]
VNVCVIPGTIVSHIYCTNKYYVRAIGPDEKNELTVLSDFMELSGTTCD